MLISLIIFCSAVEFTFVNSAGSNSNTTSAVTELHRFKRHVLRRRTRSLVFPSKAQLLLTPAFTKAVLDGRPRGLSYSVEFDMYTPLPDTIEGWKPTILVNKFKDETTTSEPLELRSHETRKDSRNLDQKFSNLTDDAIQPYIFYDYYNFPFHEEKGTNNDINLEGKPKTNRNFETDSNKFYGFASNFHKVPYSRNKYKRSKKFSSNLGEKFASHEFVGGLQTDREREQVHKQFEILGKILKIDMKQCILRAICELNSQLRAPGESIMEDIIRLILTPSHSPITTTYHGNISIIYCKKKFAVSCPYSILDSFTKMFNANTSI